MVTWFCLQKLCLPRALQASSVLMYNRAPVHLAISQPYLFIIFLRWDVGGGEGLKYKLSFRNDMEVKL